MGFVAKTASRTLQNASPSALLKLLPEILESSPASPSLRAELSHKVLQSAPFFTTSQICYLSYNKHLLDFNPALLTRVNELVLDNLQSFTPAELIDLVNTPKNSSDVSRVLLAHAESIDWSLANLSEAHVARLLYSIKDLEIAENFRLQLSHLIAENAQKFSSQSAAQVALVGGKQKFPLTAKIAEEIADRISTPRHLANGIFGFSRWPQIPSDIIFGLIKKIPFADLNVVEIHQVLSAMISRKLPAHKFFNKTVRSLEAREISAVLVLQAATQIKGLKSPGISFYLNVLPKKFPVQLDRKTASLILTGYSRAGLLPPEKLKSEIFNSIKTTENVNWEISDLCSIARLHESTDESEIIAISDLLLTRLQVKEVPAEADDVVNVLLALAKLSKDPALCEVLHSSESLAPARDKLICELALKYLHAVPLFPSLPSHRRVNVLYAASRLICLPQTEAQGICREIARGVIVAELSDHLKSSFSEASEALGLRDTPLEVSSA